MDIKITDNGEITITKKVSLNEEKQKSLIKKVVSVAGYYEGEECHDRWSALYNAYDIIFDTDIRKEHEGYGNVKISRLEFLTRTNRIHRLLYACARLYKRDFNTYIQDFIEA